MSRGLTPQNDAAVSPLWAGVARKLKYVRRELERGLPEGDTVVQDGLDGRKLADAEGNRKVQEHVPEGLVREVFENIVKRPITFREATRSVRSETFCVNGKERIQVLNTLGDAPADEPTGAESSSCTERPLFWFHPPGDLGDFKWRESRGPGIGIANTGNTCFVNAAVQALCYCPPLAQYMMAGRHSKDCERRQVKIDCLCCTLEKFVKSIFGHRGRYDPRKHRLVLPAGLRHCLGNDRNRRYGQQDTHEALSALMEKLRKADLPMAVERDFEKHAIPDAEFGTSFINQLSAGRLQERRTCIVCKRSTSTIQSFWELIVPIAGKQSTFEGSLAKYFEVELLRGSNCIWCDFCGKKQPKLIERRICRPPNVLTVVFQRVSHSGKYGSPKKLDRKICVPSVVDIEPHTKFSGFAASPLGADLSTAPSAKDSEAAEQTCLDFLRAQARALTMFDQETCKQVDRNLAGHAPASRVFDSAGASLGTEKRGGASDHVYHFFSSIAHAGSATFGHYFSYCRAPDNRLYAIDDESISLANIVRGGYLSLPFSSAYLCMFVRSQAFVREEGTNALTYKSLRSRPNVPVIGALDTTSTKMDITSALKAAATANVAESTEGITARVVLRRQARSGDEDDGLLLNGGASASVDTGSTKTSEEESVGEDFSDQEGSAEEEKHTLEMMSDRRGEEVNEGGEGRANRNDDEDDSDGENNEFTVVIGGARVAITAQCEEDQREVMTAEIVGEEEATTLGMTPVKKPDGPRKAKKGSGKPFDVLRRMKGVDSLLSQYGDENVADWDEADSTARAERGASTALPPVRPTHFPQRRTAEFLEAQRVSMPARNVRSEQDREYDRGKTKKGAKGGRDDADAEGGWLTYSGSTESGAKPVIRKVDTRSDARLASAFFDKFTQRGARPKVFLRGRKRRRAAGGGFHRREESGPARKRRRMTVKSGPP